MKKGVWALLVGLAVALPLRSETFDPDYLNLVTFKNSTGATIEFIFLSPGDSDYWGPEILGSERVLESGASLGFWILYPDECNDFDVLAIDENGKAAIIYDYTVCDGRKEEIEIVRKDMRDDTPDFDFVTVYIRNETIDVWYIFISPSDSNMWGVDYLDESTVLSTNKSVGFLFPAGSDAITYDLLAVDEDMDTYRFSFEVDSSSDDSVFAIEVSDLE